MCVHTRGQFRLFMIVIPPLLFCQKINLNDKEANNYTIEPDFRLKKKLKNNPENLSAHNNNM